MFKLIATGLALGALAASSSLAADISSPINPVPEYQASTDYASQPNDWSGFYAGVLGGYGSGQNAMTTGAGTTNVPSNGVLAGVTVGANTQIDSFVFGVEGDIDWSGQIGQRHLRRWRRHLQFRFRLGWLGARPRRLSPSTRC